MPKYYKLQSDTYIVEGTAKHAIYDLLNGHLYSITHQALTIIRSLLQIKNYCKTISSDDIKIIQPLIDRGVLVPSDKLVLEASITELKQLFSSLFSHIEITRKCNLKCSFCYEESSPTCNEKMTFDDFKIAIKNLKEVGVKQIQFIGGEPMILGRTLKDMIEYARPDFDFIEVYTNGVFINSEWAQFFKKNKVHVALSIHSYDASEHDRVTTIKHSHLKVENAVRLLKELDIPIRTSAVETKGCNIGKRPDNHPYKISPDPVRLTGRGSFNQYTFEMFQKKAITKEKKRRPINKERIQWHVSGHQCFLKNLYIGTDLNVYPCVMERRHQYGNLKITSLEKMLDSKIRFFSKDNVSGCKNCEYRYECFDCRPDSNGLSFNDKPWFCSYNPYTGEWADLKKMYNNLQHNIFHESVYLSKK